MIKWSISTSKLIKVLDLKDDESYIDLTKKGYTDNYIRSYRKNFELEFQRRLYDQIGDSLINKWLNN